MIPSPYKLLVFQRFRILPMSKILRQKVVHYFATFFVRSREVLIIPTFKRDYPIHRGTEGNNDEGNDERSYDKSNTKEKIGIKSVQQP